ncbi:unnamed protein product, partial [Prorocentrum cordatum]
MGHPVGGGEGSPRAGGAQKPRVDFALAVPGPSPQDAQTGGAGQPPELAAPRLPAGAADPACLAVGRAEALCGAEASPSPRSPIQRRPSRRMSSGSGDSQPVSGAEASQDSMFGEYIRQVTPDVDALFMGQPGRRRLGVLLESSAVKLLIGLSAVASFVGVVKETDSRATGSPLPDWLAIMEYVLFTVFSVELAVRFYVERWEALRSLYTIADIVVVCTAAAEYILVGSGVDSGLSTVKMLRLSRMLKLVRVVYRVPFFVELRKLMYMISSCLKTLFWSFLVLGIVMTMWSIVAVELVHPRVLELASQGQWSDCERCSRSFSSVFHANITFFQTIVAGDSWGVMAIPVIEAHPWTAFIFTGALLTLVFGVLNVIVAVVVDAFAEARAKDVFTRARELEWEEREEKKALSTIFKKIDKDGNGSLDFEELKDGARKVEQFSHWLRVLDIDARDLEEMFSMLDRDGSGDIDTHEFVEWMYRMKNTDSKTVSQFIKQKLAKVVERVDGQESSFETNLSGISQLQAESLRRLERAEKRAEAQESAFESRLCEVSKLLAESLQRSESMHRGIEEGLAEVRRQVHDSLSTALSPRPL